MLAGYGWAAQYPNAAIMDASIFTVKDFRAHRVAYFFHYGIDPGELDVMHSCDNPPCCNPNHLSRGTRAENHKDMRTKKRWKRKQFDNTPRGSKQWKSKLTDQTVNEIRNRYVKRIVTQKYLAQEYGINQATVWCILHDKTWKHI